MDTTFDHAPAQSQDGTPKRAAIARWTSRVLVGVPALFVLVDGVMKLLNIPAVIEASARIGYGRTTLPLLGGVELLAVGLLTFRRTAPFGAVLLSAYLGGAVATHVRLGDPLATHTLMPIYVAALVWGGLYLRDERVRALSPFGR